MRKVWIALLSCVVLAVPFTSGKSARANEITDAEIQGLSYSQGIILSWRLFANYRAEKALRILNTLREKESLSSNERELVDLMRLTIYRQEGNGNVLVPGFTDEAIEYLTEAIVLDDTSAHARRRRGFAYCKTGNVSACQRDYAVAWQMTGNKNSEALASHLASRALAYFEANKTKEGNADLREAARLFRLAGKEERAKLEEFFIRPE